MLALQNIQQATFPEFKSFIVEEQEGSGIILAIYIFEALKVFFLCCRFTFFSYHLQEVMVQFTGQKGKLME